MGFGPFSSLVLGEMVSPGSAGEFFRVPRSSIPYSSPSFLFLPLFLSASRSPQATSLITLLDAQRGLTPCLPALLSPVHHLRPCPTPATASLDEMLAQLTLLLPPPAAPAAPTPVPPAGAGAPAAGASTVTASSPPPPAPAACTAGAAATAGTTAATATATAEGAEAGGPGAMALEQADAAQQSGTEDGALPVRTAAKKEGSSRRVRKGAER